eukprot:Skav236323  [mRNA]  locus=scaffold97:171922:176667:+ [translate_table: standard]
MEDLDGSPVGEEETTAEIEDEVEDRTQVRPYDEGIEVALGLDMLNSTCQLVTSNEEHFEMLANSFPASSGERGSGSFPEGKPVEPSADRDDLAYLADAPEGKEEAASLQGLTLSECGPLVFQKLLEVIPLRSKHTGRDSTAAIFPLPTSRSTILECFPDQTDSMITWCLCVCVGLNSLWGGDHFYDGMVRPSQRKCLEMILRDVDRFCRISTVVPPLDWKDLTQIRTIDYKGDEVRVARSFRWGNISPALPNEIGVVPLVDVCYLRPESEWGQVPTAKVMVADSEWGEVCAGLVRSGICVFIAEEEVFDTGCGPLLNGLFGVSKEDWTEDGTEIYRLIMNLVPLNGICRPLQGDVDTLPSWGSMNPFFLQPSENLLVSSEDVKCFFYTMSVPPSWTRFLAFNRLVPDMVLPEELKDNRMYVASRVLPMGFLNSVSLAQHVHRNLVLWSSEPEKATNMPNQELRKDEPFSVARPNWRVYLDNYDLLEKVQHTDMVDQEGTLAPGVLALRSQYERWQVPRNLKKSVARSARCELQGATIDGQLGVAYPRETKIAKYLGLGYLLGLQDFAVQKQWQIACGGLVYFTMFRRPLLSGLNRVWTHIESFNVGHRSMRTPDECRLELFRFLALLPLARMDFRADVHPMVTCSDASTTGGGACASTGLTALGCEVAGGGVRGEEPNPGHQLRVLSIGLFDGIGALRVALDALNVKVLAHISVEPNRSAQMVVESQFPGVVLVNQVQEVSEEMVLDWSARFPQCDLVLLGAGPPCQGVSGLNVDRKGALRDLRSNLFLHVPRIRDLLKQKFTWCPVHSLMESVASMDSTDRDTMSAHVGSTPLRCDAGCFLWCNRPRLYWISWDIPEGDGYAWSSSSSEVPDLWLEGSQPITEDVDRWVEDKHRFPPYQYKACNCLVNKNNVLRVPDVEEREAMLGFAPRYTATCKPKGQRKGEDYSDTRLTLLGNTWAVPVISCLLNPLFSLLGWFPRMSAQQVLDRFRPLQSQMMQGRLMRLPLNPRTKLVLTKQYDLAYKLCNLVSIKGEDILLSSSTTQQVKFHRLRASVPARLWRWRIITGWKWRYGKEHINSLELKAILTTLRWRFEHQQHFNQRIVHMTDSLVCLHALTRGRRRNIVMPRKRVLEALQPQDRAAQRRRLGTLRELTVQPATKKRYTPATQAFFAFLRQEGVAIPQAKTRLDDVLCDYLEHLWATGSGRVLANDTVAGLQDIQPNLRHNLPGSWRLLKTWSVNEVPNRAPPIPEHVLKAMVGWSFFHGHNSFAVSLLVGYYCMLRTGELLALRSSDLLTSPRDSQVLIGLGYTKGGKRHGAAESVILGYEPAVLLTQQWKQIATPSTKLARTIAGWRALFNECLKGLGLEAHQFRPYSLRRGGATFWFAKHQSFDRIMVQGRSGSGMDV